MEQISEYTASNSRIAKNAIFLYIRSFVTMAVGLYTSRVVLKVLGVEDFGIYNLVGGVVVMFAFIQTSLIGAVGRFLTFELGKGDIEQYKKVFNIGMISYAALALFLAILCETVGLVLLRQANIPPERMDAAYFAYHLSVASLCFGIISMLYNSVVTSHEKFSFFAYYSIVEAVLKLGLVMMLKYVDYDKLKLYSIFMFLMYVGVFVTLKWYCNYKLKTGYFKWFWDGKLFRKIISFSGWTLMSTFASMGAGTGVNYIMNIFYGVVINASMGVASQVNGVLGKFVGSFGGAFSPQITKLYAAGKTESLKKLLFRSSKFSFFIYMTFAFPLMLNMDFVLNVWLDTVPEYAAQFCTIIIICTLIGVVSGPMGTAVNATGKIAGITIVTTTAYLVNILAAWLFLLAGLNPVAVACIRIVAFLVMIINSLSQVTKYKIMNLSDFLKFILSPIAWVVAVSIPLPFIAAHYLAQFSKWYALFGTIAVFLIIYFPAVYYFGFTPQERTKVLQVIKDKIPLLKLRVNNALKTKHYE